MKLINTTPAAPFNFDRLYGQEKYDLQNMTLKEVNFPNEVEEDRVTSDWSDRNQAVWDKARRLLKSTYTGDAFIAGTSDESFMEFAKAFAEEIGFQHKVDGARVVRFTNCASGYPVLRLDLTSGGKRRKRTTEQILQDRAIANGDEALSMARVRIADELQHEEPYLDCILTVEGGLGSFSIGTEAALLRNGEAVARTYNVASWVYRGRDAALESARQWASEVYPDRERQS